VETTEILAVQILLDGLISGIALAALSLAFGLVFLSTRVFHLGLCAIYVISPLVTWECIHRGLSWPVAAALGLALGPLLSTACYFGNHRPLEKKGATSEAHFVAALGGYLCMIQMAVMIFGNESRMLRTNLGSARRLGQLTLTDGQLLAAVVSTVTVVAVLLWISQTRRGLLLRAIAQNPSQCLLLGIPVHRVEATAFAASGAICALCSLLSAYETGVDANTGFIAGLPAIAALLIGGRSTLKGPILGGIFIGLVRTASAWWFSAGWQDAVTFTVMALFLLLRPDGLVRAREGGV
jgi:branched-chain amino acid transport system permease protein